MDKKKQSTGTIGAMCELYACAFLIKKGYQVFRNISPNGSVDIIAMNGEGLRKIDVKKALYQHRGTIVSLRKARTEKQIIENVEILYVNESGECFFEEDIIAMNGLAEYKKICRACTQEFTIKEKKKWRTIYCSQECKDYGRDKNQAIRQNKYREWQLSVQKEIKLPTISID